MISGMKSKCSLSVLYPCLTRALCVRRCSLPVRYVSVPYPCVKCPCVPYPCVTRAVPVRYVSLKCALPVRYVSIDKPLNCR